MKGFEKVFINKSPPEAYGIFNFILKLSKICLPKDNSKKLRCITVFIALHE
jgi:hypothetical protein